MDKKNESLTRTKDTELFYEKKFSQINNRFYKETGFDAYQNQNEFAKWINKIRENIVPASWRLYRSAINFSLFKQTKELQEVLSKKAGKKRTESNNTSRQKRKFVKKEEYEQLLEEVNKSNSKYKNILYHWIVAGNATGLRPIEWKNVKFDKENDLLIVLNAKKTNGRSHGVTRTLNIKNLDFEQKKSISFMFNTLSGIPNDKYELIFNNCRRLLYKINKKIKIRKSKKNISLYSFRHQFIANTKKKLSQKEVSALSGHKVTQTAQEHYGKKRNGLDDFNVVNPSSQDIENVTENHKEFDYSVKKQNKKTNL